MRRRTFSRVTAVALVTLALSFSQTAEPAAGPQRRGGHIIYTLQTSVLEDIASEVADMAGIGRPAPSTAGMRARARRQPQGA